MVKLTKKFKDFPEVFYREKGRGNRYWVIEHLPTKTFSIAKESKEGGRLIRVNQTKQQVNNFLRKKDLQREREKEDRMLRKKLN